MTGTFDGATVECLASLHVCLQSEAAVKYVLNKCPIGTNCQLNSEHEADINSESEARNNKRNYVPQKSFVLLERLPSSAPCQSLISFDENDSQLLTGAQECRLVTESPRHANSESFASFRCKTSGVIVKRMADDSSSIDSLHQKKRKVGEKPSSRHNDKNSSRNLCHTRSQTVVSNLKAAAGCKFICGVECDERHKKMKRQSVRHGRLKSVESVNDCKGSAACGMFTAANSDLAKGNTCSSCTSTTPASSQLDSLSLSSCCHSSEVSLSAEETLTEAAILCDVANEVPHKEEIHYKNVRRNIFDSPRGSQTSFLKLCHDGCELPDLSDAENCCLELCKSPVTVASDSVSMPVRCTSDVWKRQQTKQDCSNPIPPVCRDSQPVDTFNLNEVF